MSAFNIDNQMKEDCFVVQLQFTDLRLLGFELSTSCSDNATIVCFCLGRRFDSDAGCCRQRRQAVGRRGRRRRRDDFRKDPSRSEARQVQVQGGGHQEGRVQPSVQVSHQIFFKQQRKGRSEQVPQGSNFHCHGHLRTSIHTL